MNHPPAYEEYANKPRPAVNWDTPNGSWVGIWGNDWPDLIAIECIKVDPKIQHEIWQPDLRADKVYSAEIYPGVLHKQFPSINRIKFCGLKRIKYLFSEEMKINICQLNPEITVVVLHFLNSPFINSLNKLEFPKINFYTGLPDTLLTINPTLNPIKRVHRELLRIAMKRYLKSVSNILIGDYLPVGEELLKKYIKGKIYKTLIGIDTEIYRTGDKNKARKKLNLKSNDFIIFSSSRLVDLKQIDKLILTLAKLKHLDFKLYISGHGTPAYELFLKNIIIQSGMNDKVKLIGYVNESILVEFYQASDLFVNVSRSEGAPVSSWKAMAIEVPVFNTNVGNAYGFLKLHEAGCIVDINGYKNNEWLEKLSDIITGKIRVKTIPNEKVKEVVNWKHISERNIEIFNQVLCDFRSKYKK